MHPPRLTSRLSTRKQETHKDLTLELVWQEYKEAQPDGYRATIPIHNRETGETHRASIFVAAMGFRSYTFAEATWSQELPCWIASHIRAFAYFQGLPQLVTPDNLKAGVTKASRYEPDLNPTYNDMATHYSVAVLPARPPLDLSIRDSRHRRGGLPWEIVNLTASS